MSSNYIDITSKMTIRYHFEDEADMLAKLPLIKRGDVDFCFGDDYKYSDPMYETSTPISPEEQNGYATLEVYENEVLIYANGKVIGNELE